MSGCGTKIAYDNRFLVFDNSGNDPSMFWDCESDRHSGGEIWL